MLTRDRVQIVTEDILDETVNGVGPDGADRWLVEAHEGVSVQRAEEPIDRRVAAEWGGEGRGERLAKLRGPLQDQLVRDGERGKEGAEAE